MVDAVVDTVEDVVDAVVDTAQEGVDAAVEWVDQNLGGVAGGVAAFVGGAINGVLEGLQDQVHDVANIIRDVAGIVGAVLALDFPRVIEGVIDLVIDVVDLVIDIGRFVTGGYVVGGIVREFERNSLRRFVEQLVADTFGSDPARLAQVRTRIGLEGGTFGLPLEARHLTLRMDSANLPLWDLHERGVIDLFALAGLLSFNSFEVFPRPRTAVHTVDQDGNDTLWPVTRWTIARYLQTRGESNRLRVYALSRQALGDKLTRATEKLEQLGLRLSWNDGDRFTWFRRLTVHDVDTEAEIALTEEQLGQYLLDEGLRTGEAADDCQPLALAGFRFATAGGELFGIAAGRDISEGSGLRCATAGRSDQCCVTVAPQEASGTLYRDFWPPYFSDYVLPHELGHYFGLCHIGHDGVQNIMFSPRVSSVLDWGLLGFYLDSEPSFTLEDGRNSWRFIVDQLAHCL